VTPRLLFLALILGLPLSSHPCKPFCLGREPKARVATNDDGWEFMVAYANQSNNNIEAKYNTYGGACLIVVWVVYFFKCYLYGSPFTLVTDHQPLKFLM